MVSLGKALATRGHDVSFVTYDHGQQSTITRDGIRVIPSFSPDSGLPIVRFFVPRLTDLRKSMLESGASIFLQMGAASETGFVAAIRKTLRGSSGIFVFCIASDSDCCETPPAIVRRHELWLYRYGLSRADKIVAQTNNQREMLLTNYNKDSLVQTMPGLCMVCFSYLFCRTFPYTVS